ncbi:phage holin [Niallia circulans]|uniref:Phage holin n=1 Tax=Niallia circulans TaxID=1397 RepID=A0A553SQA6_NIACI|nr:phage holin [Niallia circulans]TRZ39180.1 phage holin [Niallia circulans]
MKKLDKGTVIRTVLLLLAFANQGLAVFGKEALPFSNDQVSSLIEMIYYVGSFILTAVVALIAWFKNNYVTAKGHQQKEVLKANNLTNAK